jgi:hypothetical protein
MTAPRRIVLPLLLALAVVAVGLTVSACGESESHHEVVEGEVLKLGDLKYTVTFSRYLNPNDNEDAAYLAGPGRSKEGLRFLRRLLRSPERN